MRQYDHVGDMYETGMGMQKSKHGMRLGSYMVHMSDMDFSMYAKAPATSDAGKKYGMNGKKRAMKKSRSYNDNSYGETYGKSYAMPKGKGRDKAKSMTTNSISSTTQMYGSY